MASLGFYSNCPSFLQRYHTAAVPPPPDHLAFHNNFTLSDTSCCIDPLLFQSTSSHQLSSFNNGVTTTNLPFQNTIKYPTLSSSSSYNPFTTLQQEQLLPTPITPLPYPTDDQFSSYTHECYQYPLIPNVWPMMELQQELPPWPEIYDYQGGGVDGSALMVPPENYGVGCNVVIQGEERSGGEVKKQNGDGLSTQSIAARVRRRKIREKTLELGKLIPGGHRMNTAEMFQAGFKYVKFLQAQVSALQIMHASPPEPIEEQELQDLLTCPSVQEKLYAAEKCIVTQTLAEAIANDQGKMKN